MDYYQARRLILMHCGPFHLVEVRSDKEWWVEVHAKGGWVIPRANEVIGIGDSTTSAVIDAGKYVLRFYEC
jgi:hypothetical protein